MKNIKKMVLVSAFAGTCLTPHAQTASPVIPTDPAIETHIREWLQKMTLEHGSHLQPRANEKRCQNLRL